MKNKTITPEEPTSCACGANTSCQCEPKQETLEEAALKYASEKLRRVIIPYKEFNANVAEYVGFVNGAKWQSERMYSEEEVSRLLETQRGNCYVAVLSMCKDEDIASATINAPEPGGDQWKKSKRWE